MAGTDERIEDDDDLDEDADDDGADDRAARGARGSSADDDDDDDEALDPIEAYFDQVDDRVDALCEGPLKPKLEALEVERAKVFSYVTRGVKIMLVPFAFYILGDFIRAGLMSLLPDNVVVNAIATWWSLILLVFGLGAGIYIIKFMVMPGIVDAMNFRKRFKQQVVSDVAAAFLPDGTYQASHHIAQQVFDDSGIYGTPASFSGDDLIRGRVGDVEYEASEIKMTGKVVFDTKRNKNHVSTRPNVTQFHGLFYHFATPRSLNGHTIIEPENAEGRFFKHRSAMQRVEIDDEAFTNVYRVYATDPREATAILTPHLRARLVKIDDQIGSTPFLSFIKNKVFIAAHKGSNALEPEVAKKNSYGTVYSAAEFFAWPRLFVQELGLSSVLGSPSHAVAHQFTTSTFAPANTLGGGSILSQPAAVGLDIFDGKGDIKAGDITTMALQEATEQDAARRPPPESRVKLAPITGHGFEATFGIGGGFWFRVLWTLGLAPFAIAGLATLAGPDGASTVHAVTAQVPIAAQAAEWATAWPIAFGVVTLLFWLWPAWSLLHVPRSLHIDRQGVRVGKLIWPFAKTFSLEQIEDVRVNEKQVVLLRRNASLLRRFIHAVPPMPSNEDARWLAAHIRRALIMFGGLQKKA